VQKSVDKDGLNLESWSFFIIFMVNSCKYRLKSQ